MKALSKIWIPFLILLSLPCSGFSQQVVEYIGQGDYVMGDGETPAVAESRALTLAERDAAEKAGVFVKSFTLVKGQTVIEDLIEAVAKHSMSVQVLEKKRIPIVTRNQGTGEAETLKFTIRIKATFQKLDIEKNLKIIRENSQYVDSYRKMKEEYENQRKELESLKRELYRANERHRQDILKKIGAEEKRFEAVHLIEAGELAFMKGDKMFALESFTCAIALRPEFAPSYAMRGAVYMELNQNDKAIVDIQKAIELDPKDAFYYAMRAAIIFGGCSKANPSPCDQALKDLNIAIGLQSNSSDFYLLRAAVYLETNRAKEALEDLTKAINLDKTSYWPGSSGIACLLMIKNLKDTTNDLYGILANITTAISTMTNSKYYLDVLKPLSDAVNEIRENRASEDQAKEILARKSIDIPNEKARMIRTDNLNFVSALYNERAEIYMKLGYPEKAKGDLKTACRIIWNEEFCKSPNAPEN